jgi:hypothetical protein
VRDAARQLAHGFHFVGLAELRFAGSFFGNILYLTDKVERLSVRIPYDRTMQPAPDYIPVLADIAFFDGIEHVHVGGGLGAPRNRFLHIVGIGNVDHVLA